MTKREAEQLDIDLAEAVICTDKDFNRVAVCHIGQTQAPSLDYPFIFGACFPYWQRAGDAGRVTDLLIEIWHAVAVLGISADVINEALMIIPQYRDIMPPEIVPRKFWDRCSG